MPRLADKIMKRIRARGRGKWVCTPKDFLDLGSRQAVDQALSRLVNAGRLRRAGRSLYDLTRFSDVLKMPAPVDLDIAVEALAPTWPHERGACEDLLRNGRCLEDAQDRRKDDPLPACGAPHHALGRQAGGFGGSGAAVARPKRRSERAGRFDPETLPSPRSKIGPVAQ